jgi:hypothetical protein
MNKYISEALKVWKSSPASAEMTPLLISGLSLDLAEASTRGIE